MQDRERNFRRKAERLKANEAFDGSARKQVTDYMRARVWDITGCRGWRTSSGTFWRPTT